MLPINILLTNFCNQNCPFCFAREEMANKNVKKEISLKDFKTVLLKMKKEPKISTVKLLGGEPTLHSQFKQIIKLSLKYFPKVQVFTNGIFPDDIAQFLLEKTPQVAFTFNVMTPGFLFNHKTRLLVKKRINQFIKKTKVTLSFTFDMNTNMQLVLKTLGKEILSNVPSFRLGFSNPVAGEKKFYKFSDFPKMGKKLTYVVSAIREVNKTAQISLNCGFTRCMFTETQYVFIKNNVNILGFSCFGKSASFDIQTDLTAFHCFPLSPIHKLSTFKKSFNSVNKQLIKKRFYYWSKIRHSICLKCPFYGFGKDKCPGPCLGFLI